MRLSRLLPLAAVSVVAATAAIPAPGAVAAARTTTTDYTLTRAFDALTGQQQTVRWAPCMRYNGTRHANVIDYKINAAGRQRRVRLVKRAVRRVHRATGLTFHYAGSTSYIPHAVNGVLQAAEQKKQTHVRFVVAWAFMGTGSNASNLLTGTEQGVGTIRWASSPTSQLRVTDAALVMKRGAHLRAGFLAGGSEGTLLLHELGHTVGLQHVDDPTQIMHAVLGAQSPSTYAPGDRAGLTRVGATQGCMTGKTMPPSNG
jgi:hypothetical protein